VNLLDTSICIDLLRGRSLRLRQRYAEVDTSELGVSSITAGELYSGALKSSRVEENLSAANVLLSGLAILPFDAGAARAYGVVRSKLEKRGTRIGDLDTLIAGHAVAINAVLVSINTREFVRVEDLAVEDWTK
jgi:tRNA(fMet)-specific endonuclease VapC